mmetsp:Transcript_38279/g.57315  ORF Transcript_38279/g.57315 Transcript_38279/m.57315 type:complete len:88 (+) Transcript_38279:973-1236(+)
MTKPNKNRAAGGERVVKAPYPTPIPKGNPSSKNLTCRHLSENPLVVMAPLLLNTRQERPTRSGAVSATALGTVMSNGRVVIHIKEAP